MIARSAVSSLRIRMTQHLHGKVTALIPAHIAARLRPELPPNLHRTRAA